MKFEELPKSRLMEQVEIIDEIRSLHKKLGEYPVEFVHIDVFYTDLEDALDRFYPNNERGL